MPQVPIEARASAAQKVSRYSERGRLLAHPDASPTKLTAVAHAATSTSLPNVP